MKNVVPNIRFKNFNSEWFKIQINDLLINRQNKNYVSKYFLDAPSISNKKYSLYKNQKFKWAPCDSIIFIKDGSVGELFYTKYDVRIASTCEYMTLNINNLFGYYLFTKEMPSIKSNILTGQVIPHLYKKDIAKLSIYYSQDANEQQKISKLFSTLDNLIDETTIKLDKLKKLKSSLIEEMFVNTHTRTPRIRYKNFKEKWNIEKIVNIFYISRGVRIVKINLLNKGYPVVSGGFGIMGYYDDFNRESNTITISQYGSAGFINYIKSKFWANDVCLTLNPLNVDMVNYYLFLLLKSFQNSFYSIVNKSTVPFSISIKNIYNIEILLSNDIDEQKKIAKLFLLLDNIMEKIEIKLNKYTKVKQTLMNEMFI